MKKKYLILGGSGFIGTNFINYINSYKDIFIFNCDKISKESTSEKFKNLKNKNNYKFYKTDLKNQANIEEILKKTEPDIIINFAAESHVDRSLDSPKLFYKNNILISLSLSEALKKLKKKFKIIHISTDEIFGDFLIGKAKESACFNPTTPYSTSKVCSDIIIKSYSKLYDYNLTIVNMCNNYGPYQFTEKLIPTALNCLIEKKKIPVYGNGKNIREWIYVDDACKAIFKITKLKKPKLPYNLGSGIRINNLNIVKLLIRLFKKNLKIRKMQNYYEYTVDRPIHDTRYALNSNKLKKAIGKYNKTTLLSGLKKTISWYQNNKEWLNACKKKYSGQRLGLKKK